MTQTATYDKFINYFTALSQLEKTDDLYDLLDTLQVNVTENQVVFDNQPMFKYFGHLDSANDMYVAIQVSPESRVLDGSVPIKITSQVTSFGMYDDEVSPVVEEILRQGKLLAPYFWELTFTFQQVNENFVFCSINGSKMVQESNPAGASKITGTTFGSNVKACMESVLAVLPNIFGVANV